MRKSAPGLLYDLYFNIREYVITQNKYENVQIRQLLDVRVNTTIKTKLVMIPETLKFLLLYSEKLT